MATPASSFTYQLSVFVGSMATGPPKPERICGHGEFGLNAAAVSLIPANPFTPSPAISEYGESKTGGRLSTSASDPRPLFRFWKCVASEAEHTGPLSPMASVERHRPLSLPRKISSGFAAFHATTCWNSPTCALMQVVALVVLRHTQPIARLHFHRSFAPA